MMSNIHSFRPKDTIRKARIQTRIEELQMEEEDISDEIRHLAQEALQLRLEREELQLSLAGGSNANSAN